MAIYLVIPRNRLGLASSSGEGSLARRWITSSRPLHDPYTGLRSLWIGRQPNLAQGLSAGSLALLRGYGMQLRLSEQDLSAAGGLSLWANLPVQHFAPVRRRDGTSTPPERHRIGHLCHKIIGPCRFADRRRCWSAFASGGCHRPRLPIRHRAKGLPFMKNLDHANTVILGVSQHLAEQLPRRAIPAADQMADDR